MPGRPRVMVGAAMLAAGATLAAGCGSSQTSSSQTPSSRTAPASPASPAPPASPAAAAAACTPGQLATSYAGTQGATGHLELTLGLRNVSRRPCRIRGYPAARLLDGRGRPLPLRVRDGHGFFPDTLVGPRSVLLAPGARAHFGLSFATNDEYAGARVCRTAAQVLSRAPAGAARSWTRIRLRGIPRIAPCGSQLVISPVHA